MAGQIVNVQTYNPAGNGVADDTSALESAFYAARNGVLLFPDARKIYVVKRTLGIGENTRLINAGAELRISVPRGKPAIFARIGFCADTLRIGVARDAQVSPALELASNTSIDRLEIRTWRNQQQANRSVPGSFGLRIRGSNTTLGFVSVTGFDNAVEVASTKNVTIRRLQIDRYLKGLYLAKSRFFELMSGVITGSGSPVADQDTHDAVNGMNGLLIEDSSDFTISDLIVHDSIEHGVRIGGYKRTERCTFNNLRIWRAGKSGMKIEPAGDKVARAIQINGLQVLDCAPPLPASGRVDASPGEREAERYKVDGLNRCGLRLVSCQDVLVNGLQVIRNENAWYSSFHGLYIARSRSVTVNAPHVCDTYQAGIRLSDGNPPTTAAVNEIYIRNPVVTFLVPQAHANLKPTNGIWIDSETRPLRNIIISGCYVRGHTAHGVYVHPPQGLRAPWPVILQGWARDEGYEGYDHIYVWPDDVDIHKLVDPV